MIAPLLALYTARFGRPADAAIEHVLTMAGYLLFRSIDIAAALTRDVPTTLMLRTLSHSSSVASSTVPVAPTPALFARISTTCVCLANSANAELTLTGSPISHVMKCAYGLMDPS